ncbi:MAG: CHAD domain-containing protein [Verrucomicrobiota bacterium]|jgi:CHAD domain-containing protein
MSYRIEKGEGLARAFGRIAAEEIDLAMAGLRGPSRGDAVHNTRKSLKRLRALLRSLRVAFPKKLFRAENQRFADAGRKISPLRDVHVQLRTLGKLPFAADAVRDKMRRDLLRRQSAFTRKIPALRKTLRQMLHASRQSLASWPLHKATPSDLAASLKRIYKQGRTASKTAARNPSPENLHEWRKKAKLLGYGFELIASLLPAKVSAMIQRVDSLTEALGDDHDLFLVWQALRLEHQSHPASDFRALAKRISSKRAKLQKLAFKLGRKLYAERPGDFARRLDRSLRRARNKN